MQKRVSFDADADMASNPFLLTLRQVCVNATE